MIGSTHPGGLTLAPSDFGTFSHKVIVGQFGDGEILAFDAVTGRFEGKFKNQVHPACRRVADAAESGSQEAMLEARKAGKRRIVLRHNF